MTSLPRVCPRCKGTLEVLAEGVRCAACALRWLLPARESKPLVVTHLRVMSLSNRWVMFCQPAVGVRVTGVRSTCDRERVTCEGCRDALALFLGHEGVDTEVLPRLPKVCEHCRHWADGNTARGYCYEWKRFAGRDDSCQRFTF
jgi:hypothetical protein